MSVKSIQQQMLKNTLLQIKFADQAVMRKTERERDREIIDDRI